MRKHTKEYKKSISLFGREIDSKIQIIGSNLTLNKENLFSINLTTYSSLFKTVMKQVDFESKLEIGKNQEINVKSGVKVNDEYEYIDYGNYLVYENEYKAETDTYLHKCYDKMLKTMIDYVPLEITYPINLREYINAIAIKCGLEFANKNSEFVNYNTSIKEDHFNNGNYTFRDVLDYIAQLVGGWFCINDDGKLEIRYPSLAKNYDKVSGENVNFTSNVDDKIRTIIVDGKSEQTTRTGKNLLENKTKNTNVTNNGITYVLNTDGTYTLNGTNNNVNNSIVWLSNSDNPNVLKAGTYYSIEQLYPEMSIVAYTGSKYITLSSSTVRVVTLAEDITARIYLQVGKGTTRTFENVIFYPMLSLTPVTKEDYEDYGASPSPDYHSEIECLKGKNIFNKNAIALNGSSSVKTTLDTGVRSTATQAGNYKYCAIELGKEELLGKTLSISSIITPSAENKGQIAVYFGKSNIPSTQRITAFASSGSITFTIPTTFPENCDRIWLLFYSNVAGTGNVNDYVDYTNLMVVEGDIVDNYQPYNTIQIKNIGKNLYRYGDISDTASNSYYINHKLLDNFESNTTYTLSLDIVSSVQPFRISIGYGDDTFQKEMTDGTISEMNNGHITFTFTTSDTTYSNLWIRAPRYTTMTAYTATVSEIMLEKGSTPSSYEQYKEDIINIDLQGNELCSLPNNIKDELVIENGRTKIIKRVEKQVVNIGNLYDGTTWKGYVVRPKGKINAGNDRLLCDRAIVSRTLNNGTMYENPANVVFVGTESDTLETLKSKYDGATLYFELATPIEIDLGEVNTLSTLNSVNNVSLDANMQTNMTITYPTEYEEFDKHFLKNINVTFAKKYGAINSVVFSRGGGSDTIYRKDKVSINKNGLTEIKITDNPFLESDDRENFIQPLFDKINGLEFYLMDVNSTGITYMELGDLYYFNMVEERPSLKSGLVKSGMRKAQGSSGGKYLCLLMNDEIKITQGLEESIFNDEPEITETDYKNASITDASIKNAIIQTNKNSADILLKVNSDNVISAINLSPENIKISSAKLDIDAIATFTNSRLADAGSTVINGANITTGSISCDRLNGGTINGQAIRGGSISIQTGNYYFNMGTSTSNPNCSGLNVGNYGIKANSNITATGFAITDSDTGKTQSINIYDGHGKVWYLTFTGGILTASEYK